MARYNLKGRVIWLTGASSGIGEGLAIRLAQHNQVFISARSEDALNNLSKQHKNLHSAAADVTDLGQLTAVCRDIEAQFGRLDMLLANAGTCEYLDVKHFDSGCAQRMMDINYMGFVKSLEAALPLLRRSSHPYIAAVSSSSIFAGLPRAQCYSASKAAITQFMECMAADLRSEGFTLSTIHPGFVDTPLTKHNDFPMPMLVSTNKAVSHIIKGLERTKYNIEFPKTLSFLLKLIKFTPPFLRHSITGSMSRNPAHEH